MNRRNQSILLKNSKLNFLGYVVTLLEVHSSNTARLRGSNSFPALLILIESEFFNSINRKPKPYINTYRRKASSSK